MGTEAQKKNQIPCAYATVPRGSKFLAMHWRWKLRVLVAMGADVERVVPRENSHAMSWRTFGEPSGEHHRCIAEYSAKHRGIFEDWSALHRLTVNDVLLESATVGDLSAMRRRVMVMSWRYRADVLTTSWRWDMERCWEQEWGNSRLI